MASRCALLIVADYFGWRPAFLVLAGRRCCCSALARCLAPEPPHNSYRPRSLRRVGARAAAGAARHAERAGADCRGAAVQGRRCLRQQAVHAVHDGRRASPRPRSASSSRRCSPLSALGGLGARRRAHGAARPAALDAGLRGRCRPSATCCTALLAVAGKSYPIMVAAVVVEHVAGAHGRHRAGRADHGAVRSCATAPFSTRCCRRWRCCRATASGTPPAWIADHGGWFVYFVASFALGLPGLLMVWCQPPPTSWRSTAAERG